MKQSPARILLVEDDPHFAETLKLAFKREPIKIEWVKTGQDALQSLKERTTYAVIVIDQHLPDLKGDELALVVRKKYPEQQIIFATGDLTQETLTELLKSGLAVGFIPKGAGGVDALTAPIRKAVRAFEQERKVLGGDTEEGPLEVERKLLASGIVGRSKALQTILERKEAYHRLPAPTLIVGESGTGKEVIAKAFVYGINELLPVNCSSFIGREHMMEAELFGVVRGAFTGADKDKVGLFEIARGRVIFLDEIHHLSLAAQAKLLRVLQEKRITRVGDNADNSRSCDFQIISAGKPEIWEMMKTGLFLKDLFYRISTYQLTIPPLSERVEDIEPLIEHFAKEFRYTTKFQKRFRAATIRLMENYPWTGEVRELRNMVEQLFGETKSDIIEPKDFTQALERKFEVVPREALEDVGYETYMRMIEVAYLKKVLNLSATQKDAALRMGISKSTLNHRLKLHGINADEWLNPALNKIKKVSTEKQIQKQEKTHGGH